jgi:hypothetical protein
LNPTVGRTINPALFVVVVVCFFLPFFTVECNAAIPEALEGLAEGLGEGGQFDFGQQDLSETVNGWQLVIGDTGEETTPPGAEDPGPDWVAVAAFAAAGLGVLLSWVRRPIGPAVAILLGLGGVGLLIWLWVRITGRIPSEAEPFVDLKQRYGFWLAVGFAAAAGLWGAARLFLERPPAAAPFSAEPQPTPPRPEPAS